MRGSLTVSPVQVLKQVDDIASYSTAILELPPDFSNFDFEKKLFVSGCPWIHTNLFYFSL